MHPVLLVRQMRTQDGFSRRHCGCLSRFNERAEKGGVVTTSFLAEFIDPTSAMKEHLKLD